MDDPDERLVVEEEGPEDPEDEEKPDPPLTRPKDEPEEDEEEEETGLGLIDTKPGCSVLSSVYPIAPAVYLTVIRDPCRLSDNDSKRNLDYTVTHQRVNVAVRPSDHTIVPRLLQAEVGLFCVVGHLVVVVVGGVLVEHLEVGAGTDLLNFGIRCITESLKRGSNRDMSENSEEQNL